MRLENLGDYNIARDALKAAGGKWEVLYKSIGDTAVAKATPKLLFIGCLIATSIIASVHYGKRGISFLKERKQKIENEAALKKELVETIEAESLIRNDQEPTECSVIS